MSGYYPVTFLNWQQLLPMSVVPAISVGTLDVAVGVLSTAVDLEEALFECVDGYKISLWENDNVDFPDVVENLSACVPWVDVVKMNEKWSWCIVIGNEGIPDVVEAL